jgi:predicted DsbA family dithiol-disulfide isomerase
MNIEIFSDLVCPWCYIGKRRLDQAFREDPPVTSEPVRLIWRAYQLYPGLPAAGMSRQEFNRLRYGTSAPTAARDRLEAEAGGAGIDLRFERIERMPNTFKGHRLVAWSRRFDVQHELAENLFSAYFEQGLDVGDDQVLLAAAAAAGLDESAVGEVLTGDACAAEVEADLSRASNIGVTAVPCFLLAGRFALPGAQETAVIRQFVERADARLAADAG